MKRMEDMLLSEGPISEIVMGNTALVRGMVEAGTRVVASYPGSPTPEIAQAIRSIPKDRRPFYFEFSTNEKVATEIAYGAAVNGHLSTVFFKSVGLNVASDTFVQLNHMNIIGGMVVVLGDDPGANSSQNEQDNRHFARLSYTPIFEPANPTEVYTYYKEAARLSKERQMVVVLRLTTHVCHAKEKVAFDRWQSIEPDNTPRFNPENGPYIPIAAHVHPMKRRALQRLNELKAYSNASPLHRLIDNRNKSRGIITMGLPFLSLMDVLEKAEQKPDILKIGVIYPIPEEPIKRFLKDHKEVKILEELDDIIEKEIKCLAFDASINTDIIGKKEIEDWIGEYTPDKVFQILRNSWPDIVPQKKDRRDDLPYVPKRPPQMCPGCGHRSAFYSIKKALSETDITVADIGCHTLGFLPPYKMGQLLMCMGASSGIGSGLSLFNNTRRVITFMGDSTFFHAGLPGIINAVFNRHNVTMILMENGTTAMTGHQDHAASGQNFNEATDPIPVRSVLEGLGVKHILEIDTYQQEKLTEIVKEAVAIDEFSVVIAKHPCMLKFMREQRKKQDYKRRKVEIDQTLCNRIHECVEQFGCPTFTRGEDGQVWINTDLCIGDGSCIQTCPASAIKLTDA
ncbi:MAG: thiamine pyrophosphate-dependent enzyme [Thermodesulfobacteriota bacterium]|nr:thiamine pyrophosphate-dependent enzyme [Thermodesulfobacteriota bacterium]